MTPTKLAFPLKTRILNAIRALLLAWPIENVIRRLTFGRNPLGLFGKIAPNHYQYPAPSPRFVTRWGIRFALDISNLIDWAIFYGFTEPSRKRLFNLISPGDVIFDIGSNIGDVTLQAAKLVGPTGRVVAFEPDPANFARCHANISLNSFSNIILQNIAIAESECTLWTRLEDVRNRGSLWLAPDYAAGSVLVQTTNLDAYCAQHNVCRIDLIKIDVEGCEMQALKGMGQSLARFRPILFIEIDDMLLRRSGSSAKELVAWLEDHSYRIVNADDGKPIDRRAIFSNRHFDVLCFPQ